MIDWDYERSRCMFPGSSEKIEPPKLCTRPPAGWHCTREGNHEGPCAPYRMSYQTICDGRPLGSTLFFLIIVAVECWALWELAMLLRWMAGGFGLFA